MDPVSTIFRNLFWLPFLLVVITIPTKGIFRDKLSKFKALFSKRNEHLIIGSLLALLIFGTTLSVSLYEPYRKSPETGSVSKLIILNYNILQGVNETGDKNYDKQLALIKELDPDIIGLQETDPARISGGNSDVVRYFTNHLTGLNYYSFYGPKTVTGTFGAAVLSKYPIISAKTFFTYSDADEIGTTEVQIDVAGVIFNVFNSHPYGSHKAELAHVEVLMERINAKENVISMGDFNWRENTVYYNISISVLQDVWKIMWPTGVDDSGYDGSDRIEHIFVSKYFSVLDAGFIVDLQSDHPAQWAEIEW